jgi:hypothetical protein
MKPLFCAFMLLCGGTALAQTKRPTADAWLSHQCVNITGNLFSNSTSLAAAYSGKSGTGPITSPHASLIEGSPGSNGGIDITTREFTGWGSTTVSNVSVSLDLSCTNTYTANAGHCGGDYSTDGGSTWTSLGSVAADGLQHTLSSIRLSSLNLSKLVVVMCVSATYSRLHGSNSTTVTVYDTYAQ